MPRLGFLPAEDIEDGRADLRVAALKVDSAAHSDSSRCYVSSGVGDSPGSSASTIATERAQAS